MTLPIPRLHLFEIDDQPWFPASLRFHVQAVLTHFWSLSLPPFQTVSPSSLVARTLKKTLGSQLRSFTFVDFCSGAGGPTPAIERYVNEALRAKGARKAAEEDGHVETNGFRGTDSGMGIDFVMTDVFPNLAAWEQASQQSENLSYVGESVDAAAAPKDLLKLVKRRRHLSVNGEQNGYLVDGKTEEKQSKVFRLFSLAFHHFDDVLAERILVNTMQTSEGFAIFELQGRDVGNLFIVLMTGPLLLLGSWYWFWGNWGLLFWTYVIPIVPFVIVYDGLISCLRTRSDKELLGLLRQAAQNIEGGVDGWRFETGRERHTWPTGTIQYFIAVKDG